MIWIRHCKDCRWCRREEAVLHSGKSPLLNVGGASEVCTKLAGGAGLPGVGLVVELAPLSPGKARPRTAHTHLPRVGQGAWSGDVAKFPVERGHRTTEVIDAAGKAESSSQNSDVG